MGGCAAAHTPVACRSPSLLQTTQTLSCQRFPANAHAHHACTHTHLHSPSRLTGATWTIFQCAYDIGEGGMPFPGGPQRVSKQQQRRRRRRRRAGARVRNGAGRSKQAQRIRRGKGTSEREKKKAIEPADAKIVARATRVFPLLLIFLPSSSCLRKGIGGEAHLFAVPSSPLLVAFPGRLTLGWYFLCPPPLVLSG